MPPNKQEKNYWAIKSAIGSLFKVLTLSTDPAQTLSFATSLISSTRAFLIQKLEDRVPDSAQVPMVLNTLMHITYVHWDGEQLSPEGIAEMERAINTIFKESAMARYGLVIYRDILYCDNLALRWEEANNAYVQTHQSWIVSNAMLARINRQLLEIIVRHDMMTFPKGDVFSLDSTGNTISDMMKQTQEA